MNQSEKKGRILIAEDVDSNFILVKVMLKNYELTRAINGVEAVQLAKEGKYDLILMDLLMPTMGGLDATREIRTFDTETPIVALTAVAFDSDKEACFAAGCNDFLTKPIKMNLLKETVAKFVGQ